MLSEVTYHNIIYFRGFAWEWIRVAIAYTDYWLTLRVFHTTTFIKNGKILLNLISKE